MKILRSSPPTTVRTYSGRAGFILPAALAAALGAGARGDGEAEAAGRQAAALREDIRGIENEVGRLRRRVADLQARAALKRNLLHKTLAAIERSRRAARFARHRPGVLAVRLLELLGHPLFKVRSGARRSLIALGSLALEILDKARPADVEVRFQLAAVLARIRADLHMSAIAAGRGGLLVHFTNQWGPGWTAGLLIDGKISNTSWCNSDVKQNFVQEFTFAFAGRKVRTVRRIGINNYARGYEAGGVKRFEVLASTDAQPRSFQSIGKFTARSTAAARFDLMQRFDVSPVRARWVKLRTLTNHGNPTWVMVNEFEVYVEPDEASATRALEEGWRFVKGTRGLPRRS